ncbi:hypothetical protein LEP1GSC062_3932 [Leptospira alexanderi serovar Manhao 3 str. L 60]|uniref:Uncharacterized protein n=1 Tax=Leptospira alexanderi serovar Manhao 3 str. L 60 TaxID=1049759 RepID=V6I8T9_9LEPT|nr:hypothetical protein LEP1GSC062_3932 [Leptospira alexanderi serovar Manhao 3 str. L 60]
MTLNEFARNVLLGSSLEDKLFSPSLPPIDVRSFNFLNIPSLPVREKKFGPPNKRVKFQDWSSYSRKRIVLSLCIILRITN